MVARFFGVEANTLQKVGTRNSEELERYGYKVLKGSELKAFKGQVQDVLNLDIPKFAPSLRIYPIEAVVVVGMMLTESKVAEQLRSEIIGDIYLLKLVLSKQDRIRLYSFKK